MYINIYYLRPWDQVKVNYSYISPFPPTHPHTPLFFFFFQFPTYLDGSPKHIHIPPSLSRVAYLVLGRCDLCFLWGKNQPTPPGGKKRDGMGDWWYGWGVWGWEEKEEFIFWIFFFLGKTVSCFHHFWIQVRTYVGYGARPPQFFLFSVFCSVFLASWLGYSASPSFYLLFGSLSST